MKEALLEKTLRKMRLRRVLPYIRRFSNPSVLDVGCGWEARLLREIEPYIARGIGIDFKAPEIKTEKLRTFSYFFEPKEEVDSMDCNAQPYDLPRNEGISRHTKQSEVSFIVDCHEFSSENSRNDTHPLTPSAREGEYSMGELESANEGEYTTLDSSNPAIADANSSIFDEKSRFSKETAHSLFSSARQGSYLVGNDCSRVRRIRDLSQKDEFAGGGGGNNVSLPFKDETFEVVTMLAVLEHLNYPLEMLREIARVLKPNGVLLLTVPSHAAKPVLEFLAFKLKIVSEAEILDHKRYYNKADISALVGQIPALSLEKHSYFQLGMNNFVICVKNG